MKAGQLILGLLILSFVSTGLYPFDCEATADRSRLRMADPLPTDKTVKIGKLENGLTYYIKKNPTPENRAYLLLALDVGSVLEDDDQLGVAHFVEHMGFNGTKHFPKQEIVKYLQSVGVSFGGGVNAFTGFDQTAYVLAVPTDTAGVVEKGFQILEDWARWAEQSDEEIQKERGVILEEWRLHLGSGERYLQKQLPVIFKDSRYAGRLPIGTRESIETFAPDALRRFYRDWYRPDLMAVIAVGDFDPRKIEKLVVKHFASIPRSENPRTRTVYTVPDHDGMAVSIETDPEDTGEGFTLYLMRDRKPQQTVADYRRKLIARTHDNMFNWRVAELSMQENPPVLGAGGRSGTMVRTKEAYFLSGSVPEGGLARGIEAILTEVARVKHHGFTQTELDRAKQQISRGDEWWDQGDKLGSSTYASWCLSHFLRDEPILNARLMRELNAQLLPGIVLDDVNGIFGQRFSDATTVLLVTAPEKYRDTLPTAESVSEQFSQIEAREAGAIADVETDRPLLAEKPKPGSIVEEKSIPEIGVTEWTLSNGVRVVLRPSDWDRDRIFFDGFSPGGTSVCGDDEYEAVSVVSQLIRDCGAGNFDRRELRTKSMKTIAHAVPYVWETREGIDGKALARDVQTMFELLYLRFTSPLVCEDAFRKWQDSKREWIKTQDADPRFVFYDTLGTILSQNHPRRRHISTLEELEAIDLDTGYRVFRDRFSDASDFTFVFYGDFDVDDLKPLILTYVGSLPSTGRKETWRDIGVRPPRGVVKKVIRKGIEPQAEVAIVFEGPLEWSRQEEAVLRAMGDALDERLRNTLREELGGTYSATVAALAGADPFSRRVPYSCYEVYIHFGCAPERCEELVNAVFAQIDSLKKVECDERTVSSIRETQKRYFEGWLKKNSYWGSHLVRAYFEGEDPREIPKEIEYVRTIDAADIREAALKYLDLENYVQLIRMPEGTQKAETGGK